MNNTTNNGFSLESRLDLERALAMDEAQAEDATSEADDSDSQTSSTDSTIDAREPLSAADEAQADRIREEMELHNKEVRDHYHSISTNAEGGQYKHSSDMYRKLIGEPGTGRGGKAEEELMALNTQVCRTLVRRGSLFEKNSAKLWFYLLNNKQRVIQAMANLGYGLVLEANRGLAYLVGLDESLKNADVEGLSDEAFGLDAASGRTAFSLAHSLVLVLIRQMEINQASETNVELAFTLGELAARYTAYDGNVGSDEPKFYKKLEGICNKFCELNLLRLVNDYSRHEQGKGLPSLMYQVTPLFPFFANAKLIGDYTSQLKAYVAAAPEAMAKVAHSKKKRGPKPRFEEQLPELFEPEQEED